MSPQLWNKCTNDFNVFQAIVKGVKFIAYTAREEESDGISGIFGIFVVESERLFKGHRKSLRKN